jgi:hypothetical protein
MPPSDPAVSGKVQPPQLKKEPMTWERGYRAGEGVRAAAVVAVLFASVTGWAEAPATLGLHVGDGVLHPFLEGDANYASLVGFYPSSSSSALVPTGDLIIHARPGLKFELANPSTTVNFNGSVEYLFYTGLLYSATRDLSRPQANVAVNAALNKDGPVEVQLGDTLSWSNQTQNPAIGVGVVSLFNNVRLAVPIHPGGRALEITPSAAWGVEFFSPLPGGQVSGCTSASTNVITCDPTKVHQMNYSNASFGLNGSWKFLPKTALVVDVASDLRTYWDSTAGNAPATLLRAQAGLIGLISTHFSVTLLAGYVHDFAGTNLNNVIGQAEVAYAPSEMIKVSLGYLRTVLPVPALVVYVDDRPYLRGTVGLWAGRLTLNAGLAADLLNYYYSKPTRSDWVITASAGATVAVLPWMDVGLMYGGSYRGSSASVLQSVNVTDHEVTLRLGLHY